MRKLALSLSLILIFPTQTFAQDSPNLAIPANECPGLARACSAAARELKAARELITGYEMQIAAADSMIELAKREIDSLRKLQMLSEARAQELQVVIEAEREAKTALIKLKEEQAQRIAGLEKKLNRSRKFALVAGAAAVVAILIGVRR